MTDIAIHVERLSKLYHIGAAQKRHDTLRDAISDFRLQIADWITRRSAVSGQPSEDTIWALRDVSFEVKRGEVVGTLAPHCVWCSAGVIGRNGAGKSTTSPLAPLLQGEGKRASPSRQKDARSRLHPIVRHHAALCAASRTHYRAFGAVQVSTGAWVRCWKHVLSSVEGWARGSIQILHCVQNDITDMARRCAHLPERRDPFDCAQGRPGDEARGD